MIGSISSAKFSHKVGEAASFAHPVSLLPTHTEEVLSQKLGLITEEYYPVCILAHDFAAGFTGAYQFRVFVKDKVRLCEGTETVEARNVESIRRRAAPGTTSKPLCCV